MMDICTVAPQKHEYLDFSEPCKLEVVFSLLLEERSHLYMEIM